MGSDPGGQIGRRVIGDSERSEKAPLGLGRSETLNPARGCGSNSPPQSPGGSQVPFLREKRGTEIEAPRVAFQKQHPGRCLAKRLNQ